MSRIAPGDRVILRLPSWLGDFVMAEPVVRATWERVMGSGAGGVLSLCAPAPFLELFDESFPGAARVALRGPDLPEHYRGHDRALFLNGSLGSVIAAARAGVSERAGWSSGARAPFLTLAIRRARESGGRPVGWGIEPPVRRALPRPFTADCVELAAQAGIEVRERAPRLRVSDAARARVAEHLAGSAHSRVAGDLVAVNVGGREGSAKGVPSELWARAIEMLARDRASFFVLLCGPGEEASVRRVAALLTRPSFLAVLDPPAPLGELAAWAERAALFLCADGGARHVARAAGARTLVLFGPTDPRHTSDDLDREELLVSRVPCGPCHLECCPLSGEAHHACMRSHDPERVAEEARALLVGD